MCSLNLKHLAVTNQLKKKKEWWPQWWIYRFNECWHLSMHALVTSYLDFLLGENIHQHGMPIDPSCILEPSVSGIPGKCRGSGALMHWLVNRPTASFSDSYIIKTFYPDTCPPARMLDEMKIMKSQMRCPLRPMTKSGFEQATNPPPSFCWWCNKAAAHCWRVRLVVVVSRCKVLENCITDVPFGVFRNGNNGGLVLLLMLSMRSLQSTSDGS